MKKIKEQINQKDRVICVTVHDSHKFYYKPVGSKERYFLFATDSFHGSVFAYFRDKGRQDGDLGFSLTIRELYEFRMYRNVKLTQVMERIPKMIEYIVRIYIRPKDADTRAAAVRKPSTAQPDRDDFDRAA